MLGRKTTKHPIPAATNESKMAMIPTIVEERRLSLRVSVN